MLEGHRDSHPSEAVGPAPPASPVTMLLKRWQGGSREALDDLAPLVYRELHRLAGTHMRREAPGHLLQTTALVHETYLRLVDACVPFRDRVHFFAVCARIMRRVLVDHARRVRAERRGGGRAAVPLDLCELAVEPADQLLRLEDALHRLATLDPRKAQVVELRFFGGFTIQETADHLALSPATVERDLQFARAWLARELLGGGAPGRP
jgi:RNA polymerase sigma factor (TIGR02999 family)